MDIDLRTNFGGLMLPSPIVIGACPLTAQESTRIALASAGAGAIVLPSLHQEEVVGWQQQHDDQNACCDSSKHSTTNSYGTGCKPPIIDADSYLSLVKRATVGAPIPIIASLNGTSANEWVDFASQLESAGAAGIELNIHRGSPQQYDCPREIEDQIIQSVILINRAVDIPVFVKLGREFTSVSHFATKLLSGANAMVLHGRSPGVDICLDNFSQTVRWGLSNSGQLGQTLSSILRVHEYCPAMPLAANGGISDSEDVIKVLLSGADVAMVVSAVYRDGADVVRHILDGLREFMQQRSVVDLHGLKELRPIPESGTQQRQTYKATLAEPPATETVHAQVTTTKGDRFGHRE